MTIDKCEIDPMRVGEEGTGVGCDGRGGERNMGGVDEGWNSGQFATHFFSLFFAAARPSAIFFCRSSIA